MIDFRPKCQAAQLLYYGLNIYDCSLVTLTKVLLKSMVVKIEHFMEEVIAGSAYTATALNSKIRFAFCFSQMPF